MLIARDLLSLSPLFASNFVAPYHVWCNPIRSVRTHSRPVVPATKQLAFISSIGLWCVCVSVWCMCIVLQGCAPREATSAVKVIAGCAAAARKYYSIGQLDGRCAWLGVIGCQWPVPLFCSPKCTCPVFTNCCDHLLWFHRFAFDSKLYCNILLVRCG